MHFPNENIFWDTKSRTQILSGMHLFSYFEICTGRIIDNRLEYIGLGLSQEINSYLEKFFDRD